MAFTSDDGYMTLTALSRMLGMNESILRRYADLYSGWLRPRISSGRRRYFHHSSGEVFGVLHDLHQKGASQREIGERLATLLGQSASRDGRSSHARRMAAESAPQRARSESVAPETAASRRSELDSRLEGVDALCARLGQVERLGASLEQALAELARRVQALEHSKAL